MTGIDPAMAAALDRLTPPPMNADFADRVMALTGVEAFPPLPVPGRSVRRSRWARGRNIVLGVAGFSFLSAAAAASGLLGQSAQNLPVIAQIAERIAPKPKAAPVVRKPDPPKPPVVEPTVEPAPVVDLQPVTPEEVRRELIARRIAERLAKRDAAGGDQQPRRIPPGVRERLRQMPVEERRALLERVRQIRAEQAGTATPLPERAAITQRAEEIETRRAARRAGISPLQDGETGSMQRPRWSPEQRARWRAEFERRRALRNQPPTTDAAPDTALVPEEKSE